eukprot:scaffold4829_cov129-Cylindrotheca_fusiformis.AAC.13
MNADTNLISTPPSFSTRITLSFNRRGQVSVSQSVSQPSCWIALAFGDMGRSIESSFNGRLFCAFPRSDFSNRRRPLQLVDAKLLGFSHCPKVYPTDNPSLTTRSSITSKL